MKENQSESKQETELKKGIVSKYFPDKGFGFIKGYDGKEYFVHITKVSSHDELKPESEVSFHTVETTKGIQATDVIVL